MKRVALIGSRETPQHILRLMSKAGYGLSSSGCFGISGGAPGADTAWLASYGSNKQIIIPHNGFNGLTNKMQGVILWQDLPNEGKIKSVVHAREFVPDYEDRSKTVQILLARDANQVLGEKCDNPVDAVFYWAPEQHGKIKGGTRVAVYIARKFGIATFNLAFRNVLENFKSKYEPESFDIFKL
ncbi:hypothetical protein [Erwinia phage Virsaitis27]|nr:hypothetical protein [Erwinia phage Virsaitis27]